MSCCNVGCLPDVFNNIGTVVGVSNQAYQILRWIKAFVLLVGVEPTFPRETDFEPAAYASSATGACIKLWCLKFIVLRLVPGPESNRALFILYH